MSFFGVFGKETRSVGTGVSRDENSQTDFEFDEDAQDGRNIGIRVDPNAPKAKAKRIKKLDRLRDIDLEPEKMLMAEKVFYGQADSDEPWSVEKVNSTQHEEHNGKEQPERAPCDPCQNYKQCMRHCMSQGVSGATERPVEEHKQEAGEMHGGRSNGHGVPRSTSHDREEVKRSIKTDKPRRQCSDLCRVVKNKHKEVNHTEDHHQVHSSPKDHNAYPQPPKDPCADPCPPRDPCADPCCPRDPCVNPCVDPCFDSRMYATSEAPNCPTDPCNDPCSNRRQRVIMCYDPCRDPCRDPCNDPCRDLCKDPCQRDPCEDPYRPRDTQPDSQDMEPHDAEGDAANEVTDDASAESKQAESQHKEPCVSCPPCPPCPQCPACPECPQCPPCPTTSSNKSMRPCNTSSASKLNTQPVAVKEEKEESCNSIVCPEESE